MTPEAAFAVCVPVISQKHFVCLCYRGRKESMNSFAKKNSFTAAASWLFLLLFVIQYTCNVANGNVLFGVNEFQPVIKAHCPSGCIPPY